MPSTGDGSATYLESCSSVGPVNRTSQGCCQNALCCVRCKKNGAHGVVKRTPHTGDDGDADDPDISSGSKYL